MAGTSVVSRRGTDQFRGLFTDTWAVKCTLNLASVADGATGTDTITVPGVALGAIVIGQSFGVSQAGLVIDAYVSAANVVTVAAINDTGGAVDLASTTVRVVVGRML